RRRHTRWPRDWSSDVCSSDLVALRKWRESLPRPLAQGDGKRLLHRILGDVDVAEDADQGSYRSAGFLAEDAADLGLVDLAWGVDVVHAVRPRVPARRGGPRSASSRSRRSWPPMRAPRRGPRPR